MKKATDVMSKTGKWLLVFGFIFSQLSFPLSVFAEEVLVPESNNQEVPNNEEVVPVLLEETQPEAPVVTINGVETLEHTVAGNETEIVVVMEYQGEKEEATFDFSKKLYGIYEYTFSLVEKTVTINYSGDNAKLLAPYEVVTDLTKELTCGAGECTISGFGTDLVTVADIKGYYNLSVFEEYYGATVTVNDGEEELLDTDSVVNGYTLNIVDNGTDTLLVNKTPKSTYTINRVGDVDVPADGLVNIKDQEAVLDDLLQENEVTSMNDVNADGELNILDATDAVFMGEILGDEEVTDVLTNTLEVSNNEILVDEEVEVKLLVSGFDKASLYGIEGLLSYNKEVLELVGATLYEDETLEDTQNLGYLNLENNKFAYVLLNGFNKTDVALLTLKFKALAVGESEITLSNIVESYGEVFELESDTVTTSVTVLEYGKGGDVEDDDTTTEEEIVETKPVVKPVVLSSDYYIKNLVIKGYEIDFNMYTYEYSIKVANDVTSLDFEVLLNSNHSIYYVEGNDNFKVGTNYVYLVVKAENGSTKTYTILVEKEEAKKVVSEEKIDEDETEEGNVSASKTIIIILIILVIIGLIYVIFKDDEEDKKEIKKDSQPEKKKEEKVRIEQVKVEEVKVEKVKDNKPKTNNSTKKNTNKSNKKKNKK